MFEEFFTTPEDLGYIQFWIAKANEVKPFVEANTFDNDYPLSDETLKRILTLADTHPQGRSLDQNLVNLMLANRSFERNDVKAGMDYYQRFDKENFAASCKVFQP